MQIRIDTYEKTAIVDYISSHSDYLKLCTIASIAGVTPCHLDKNGLVVEIVQGLSQEETGLC